MIGVPVWTRPTLRLPDRDPPGCPRSHLSDRDQGTLAET